MLALPRPPVVGPLLDQPKALSQLVDDPILSRDALDQDLVLWLELLTLDLRLSLWSRGSVPSW